MPQSHLIQHIFCEKSVLVTGLGEKPISHWWLEIKTRSQRYWKYAHTNGNSLQVLWSSRWSARTSEMIKDLCDNWTDKTDLQGIALTTIHVSKWRLAVTETLKNSNHKDYLTCWSKDWKMERFYQNPLPFREIKLKIRGYNI